MVKYHDFYLEKRGPVSRDSRTFPVPFDPKLRKKKKYKKLLSGNLSRLHKVETLTQLFNNSIDYSDARDNFFALCRDGKISNRDPNLDSRLRCRLLHHRDPFLRLGPFKVEEMNSDPFIVVFNEFVTEPEMSQLKTLVSPKLHRSQHNSVKSAISKIFCWICIMK